MASASTSWWWWDKVIFVEVTADYRAASVLRLWDFWIHPKHIHSKKNVLFYGLFITDKGEFNPEARLMNPSEGLVAF